MILATHSAPPTLGKRHRQRDDQRENVACSVAEDRSEARPDGDLGGRREPAGAEEVPDPERQDVVVAIPPSTSA